MLLKQIATMKSDFKDKFGVPRQSGLVKSLKSYIIFSPKYRTKEALKGLLGFTHIWLIWGFSSKEKNGWSPTVRPPRLGGNVRMGVFATRSPNRPNPIGLSCVEIEKIESHPKLGDIIHVLGADLVSGTAIYDIKPYLPFVDSHPYAKAGFAQGKPFGHLNVTIGKNRKNCISKEKMQTLIDVLAEDPRPQYKKDKNRVYGLKFAGFEVKFTVDEKNLTVFEIKKEDEG